MIKGIIYKIVNDINDKVYIGQTTRTLEIRWSCHCKDAYFSKRKNNKFYNAIRKYGKEHFTPSVIEYIDNELLDEREIYWIKEYNSVKCGYNTVYGGNGCVRYNRDEIISLWRYGYDCSEIAEKIGCRYMTVSYALSNYGIDQEYKARRSAMKRERLNGVLISQFDLNGVYITTWHSSGEAKRVCGYDQNEINRCCARQAYSHKGYLWKRLDDPTPISVLVEANKNKRITPGK